MTSRDDILLEYLDRLPFAPYPVQEEAMYAWAASDQGVLLSAPTGMGKTLVADGVAGGMGTSYRNPALRERLLHDAIALNGDLAAAVAKLLLRQG